MSVEADSSPTHVQPGDWGERDDDGSGPGERADRGGRYELLEPLYHDRCPCICAFTRLGGRTFRDRCPRCTFWARTFGDVMTVDDRACFGVTAEDLAHLARRARHTGAWERFNARADRLERQAIKAAREARRAVA